MSWLDEVMDSTKELESPRSFFYWSGLASISAVLRDNVWQPRAGAKMLNVYPNIYVMLLAGSALKKGPPIGLAKALARQVNNTKIIVGRASVPAILKELSTSETRPGGHIVRGNCGFFAASEFSSSIVEDSAAFNILTDIYDRNYNEGDWKQLLKSDTFSLKSPTLTMLVATNDPHLKDFVKEKDVYGGFFGRMFVIREDKVSRLNSLMTDLENPPDEQKLGCYLKKLAELKGPFSSLSNTEAGKFYNEWYNDFYSMIAQQEIEDKTGTIGRFGDSVIKVAMLLSLSERPELSITLSAMQEAVRQCEKFVEGIRRAMVGRGSNNANFTEQKALIINELLQRENHIVSRAVLLKKYWMHLNADELDNIIRTFDDAGMVKPRTMGGTMVYEMPKEIAEKLIERIGNKK